MPEPPSSSLCPRCGHALPQAASRGLCPKCLLTSMLDGGALASVFSKRANRPDLPRPCGPYELIEELARGGMGVVYKARQPQVNRIVAVKVLAAGQFASPDFVKRFRTEAEAVASLEHPHIVPIHEVGECQGQPFFSMKFVEGGSLSSLIANHPSQISNAEAAVLLAKLAYAVHFAHQRGILHRDIKPGNVLMDATGEPLLTDFGLAKFLEKDSTLTHTMAMMGTPSYMSPEQARGDAKNLTIAVDVYGLGAVFYELLTGQPPFTGGTDMETVRQVLEKEPRRPTAIKPGIDRDLETICLKCLEKDPARRYTSAAALAQDLERWQRHEPVSARPPSAAYILQKMVRRNKAGAALLAGLALLLVGSAVISSWQARIQSLLRQRAEANQSAALKAGHEALAAQKAAEQAQTLAAQQRDLAQERLYDSLVREAHSIGIIRPLGYRRELLDRIRQALAIPTASKDMDVLRSEAAQCLGNAVSLDPVNLVDPPSSILDFELNPDGTLVAFAAANDQLALYETAKGTAVARLGTPGKLVQVMFALDGETLFGRTEELLDARGGKVAQCRLIEWLRSGDGSWALRSERLMPELRRLIGSRQGVIAACQASTNLVFRLVEEGTNRVVGALPIAAEAPFAKALDLALDSRLAAFSGGSDDPQTRGTFEVWDLSTQRRRILLDPGLGRVLHLRFRPDERFLACTAEYGVIVYETSQFKSVNTYREFLSSGSVWGGDGTVLAVPLDQENGVRLFNINSGTEVGRLRTEHQVLDVRCSSDGSVLVAVPRKGATPAIRLVDNHERRHLAGHLGGVPCVEFSRDGAKIASTGKDGVIRIWDGVTGKLLQAWQDPDRAVPGQTVCFSPDARLLASGNYENNEIALWSLEDGRRLFTLGDPTRGQTWTCAFSPDGRILAAAGTGLRAWALSAQPVGPGKPPIKARELFAAPFNARNLQFDPQGAWIVFQGDVTRDGQFLLGTFIRGLDPLSQPKLVERQSYTLQTLGIADHGRTLVYDKMDRILNVWDTQSRRVVRTLLALTSGEISSTFLANFRLSPDGSKIAVANYNGLGVHIYDWASGRRLYSLPEEAGPIWWLAWSPDCRSLAVSRSHGDISLWNLPAVEAVLSEAGLAP